MYAPVDLRADKKVVLAAVRHSGLALRSASAELRADKEVVLEAVGQDGSALMFASAALRADKKVVLVALKSCDWAFEYASAELRDDPFLVWFQEHRDKLTEVFGEGRLNYAFLAEKYDSRALNFLSNTQERPNGPTPIWVRFSLDRLAALSDKKSSEEAAEKSCTTSRARG